MESPTIASEEAYSEWTDQVRAELTARRLDIGEAYDLFSFRSCYEEYGMNPHEAVDEYEGWISAE